MAKNTNTRKPSKMVARAGRAIFNMQSVGARDASELAYWAIKAIRKPSPEMIAAAAASIQVGGIIEPWRIYTAMIDAALEE